MSIRPFLHSAAFALAASAPVANAALILDTAEYGTGGLVAAVSAGNDMPGAPTTVLLGQLRATTAGSVTFTTAGYEAGYLNSLWFEGTRLFLSPGGATWTPVSDVDGPFAVGPGLLRFTFCTSGGPEVGGSRCVENASAASQAAQAESGHRGIGFQAVGENVWLAYFDDSGAGPDNDYDDLIARIAFTPSHAVPAPGALGLLAAGFAGFALTTRRRAR
ncbi:MAG: PEP-CTERM sorting domain-containing protein [Burkholderiales bacterium]|jgi:hypothetical protein